MSGPLAEQIAYLLERSAFYREKLYESVLGFRDLEDFMKNFWEAWALSKGMS